MNEFNEPIDRLLCGLLFIALLCLHLSGACTISWWWITAPLYGCALICGLKKIAYEVA
jgi:hypothetical protein